MELCRRVVLGEEKSLVAEGLFFGLGYLFRCIRDRARTPSDRNPSIHEPTHGTSLGPQENVAVPPVHLELVTDRKGGRGTAVTLG